jgi:hypothetical protein
VVPAPPINLTNVELLKGGVTIRLAANTLGLLRPAVHCECHETLHLTGPWSL